MIFFKIFFFIYKMAQENTTVNPGNTKAGLTGRHFQLTLNNVNKFDSLKSYLLKSKMLNYIIASKEKAPTTGHEHIHIYVQYSSPKKILLHKLEGAHIERCKGSPQQNYDYIVKDGDIIFEQGELRKAGAKTIEDVLKMKPEERNDLDIRYYNIVKQINNEEALELDIDDWNKGDVKVIYITGDTGMGKSDFARKLIKSHLQPGEKYNLVKHTGDFWEGIGQSKVALYDEFRDWHMCASEFIDFIDYNKHIMNIKGGHKINNYTTIIITSSIHPEQLYKNVAAEQQGQWLRRMKVIDLNALALKSVRLDDEF